MRLIRPDLCGALDDQTRCVYTDDYHKIGNVFGFTCSKITGSELLFPCYPASAMLMGTDTLTGTPHSLLWTYINKPNGIGFAMNPAGDHYHRFHMSKINDYELWHLKIK